MSDAATDDGVPATAVPGRVGIVLVSHSAALAEATRELAHCLAGGESAVSVATAGGAQGEFGAGASEVLAAATRVDGGAGVAVAADVGSSVLTVRMLLTEGELPTGTSLLDAPFVEGTIAAVAAVAAGDDLEGVLQAAHRARAYRKR